MIQIDAQEVSVTCLVLKEGKRPQHRHRKQPVLLRADFVLIEDPRLARLTKGDFVVKQTGKGSCSKAAGGP